MSQAELASVLPSIFMAGLFIAACVVVFRATDRVSRREDEDARDEPWRAQQVGDLLADPSEDPLPVDPAAETGGEPGVGHR